MNDGRKDLHVVNARGLSESLGHKTSFVMNNDVICTSQFSLSRSRNKLLGAPLNQGIILNVHRGFSFKNLKGSLVYLKD